MLLCKMGAGEAQSVLNVENGYIRRVLEKHVVKGTDADTLIP